MSKKPQAHRKLSDQEFSIQFTDCTLKPAYFTHEAHLRLAWIELNRLTLDEAIESVCQLIQNYAAALGATDKFNRTITTAAVKMVDHFMRRSQSDRFEALLAEFPRMGEDFKGLMNAHYSFDIYRNAEARNTYLEPDLAPFD